MSIMRRELFNIAGYISIYSYGLAIALGIVIFVYLATRNPRCKKLVSSDGFIQATMVGLALGIVGARLLFIASNWNRFDHWYEIFYLWDGGLSVLGAFLAILLVMPVYLKNLYIPALPFFDLVALYAPLLHAFSRLGCFMAGCCHGAPTNLPWAITYTDSLSEAPLNVPLHPTQLYTSLALIATFLLLQLVQNKLKPGQILMVYLMCEGTIRFGMDFLRDDHEFLQNPALAFFTLHQWISIALFLASFAGFVILEKMRTTRLCQ